MKAGGKSFSRSTNMLNTNKHLQTKIGKNKIWFNQFRPVDFPEKDIVEQFLLKLFKLNICCHIAGTFAAYSAGIFRSFGSFMLHVALTDDPFVNLLMQRGNLRTDVFYMDDFHFQFRDVHPPHHRDIAIYTLTKDDFTVKLVVIGFDTAAPCGPSSNADFAYFIFDNYEVFSFKKNCITTLPSEDDTDPTMLYLQSHRANSDGWRDNIFCSSCKIRFMDVLQIFALCKLPAKCSCNVCNFQPPSLQASASHVVFNHTFNLENFRLTADTTYEQYVYACLSNRVNHQRLLPPRFPEIELSFRCDKHNFENKLHSHCPGSGFYGMKCSTLFLNPDLAIGELVTDQNFFWCSYCQKPLFFPHLCLDHF